MILPARFVFTAACIVICIRIAGSAASAEPAAKNDRPPLAPADVFQLEFAADPQSSPDGKSIAYLRKSTDIMTNRVRSQLWLVAADGRTEVAMNITET